MKRWLMIVAAVAMAGCTQKQVDFASIEKIDAHIHLRTYGAAPAEVAAADNFRLFTIVVDHYDIPMQQEFMLYQRDHHPDRVGYITSFPMEGWDEPDWQERTIEHLRGEFEKGAIGVKVWKNIGMVVQDKAGRFVRLDDPRFDPIIDFIQAQDKTLLGHIGEPRDCWLPLEEMVTAGNRSYYRNNPQYHMYLHPEYPAYEDHIEAVSNMLAKHPGLRYVGAHLASIEWNVHKLAGFLDEFPNAAVDMAARIDDLQNLDREEVRAFLIKYQGRLLYATDIGIAEDHEHDWTLRRFHGRWMSDWTWLATDSLLERSGYDRPVQGLALPPKVLKKIYAQNARKWYPGF